MALILACAQISTQPRRRESLHSGLSSPTLLQRDSSRSDVVTELSIENEPIASVPHRTDDSASRVVDRGLVSDCNYPSSNCSCRPRKNFLESSFRLGPVVFLRSAEVAQQHRVDCPYYLPPQGSKQQFGFTFRVGTSSRKWDIKTAVNYVFSAGTFSLSPTVTFKATVSWDHPSFSALLENKRLSFQRITADLMKIFGEGRGTPTDTTPSGQTLFHVGYSQCERNRYITNMYKVLFNLFSYEVGITRGALNEAYFHDFQKCVSTLQALGVPTNEVDIGGRRD